MKTEVGEGISITEITSSYDYEEKAVMEQGKRGKCKIKKRLKEKETWTSGDGN
jgi:hypothetical protein